jgi:hypothetical protein
MRRLAASRSARREVDGREAADIVLRVRWLGSGGIGEVYLIPTKIKMIECL